MKEIYEVECSKYRDIITLENGIIEECMPLLIKFKGQPIGNLIKWSEKVFGQVTIKRME